jgi:hypothetical protein
MASTPDAEDSQFRRNNCSPAGAAVAYRLELRVAGGGRSVARDVGFVVR